MSKFCQITGKVPLFGNSRSHAMNAVKVKFLPNLQIRKFWIESKECFITLRVTAKGMRIIDKKGIENVFKKILHLKNNNQKKISKNKIRWLKLFGKK